MNAAVDPVSVHLAQSGAILLTIGGVGGLGGGPAKPHSPARRAGVDCRPVADVPPDHGAGRRRGALPGWAKHIRRTGGRRGCR
jgi:hypothetical protein